MFRKCFRIVVTLPIVSTVDNVAAKTSLTTKVDKMAKNVDDYDANTRAHGADSLLNALLGFTSETKNSVTTEQRQNVAIALLGHDPRK
jgi:hypothetical protein